MHGTMDVRLVGLDQATDAVLLQAIEQARRDMVTPADVSRKAFYRELGRVQDHPATDAVLYQAIAQARLGTVMDLGLSRRAEGRELERVRRQIHAAKQLVYDRCQVPSAGRAVSAAPSCPPRGPVPTAERTLTAMQLRVSLSPLSR